MYIYTPNGKPSPESLTKTMLRTYHPVLSLTHLPHFQHHLLFPILSVSNLKSTNILKNVDTCDIFRKKKVVDHDLLEDR